MASNHCKTLPWDRTSISKQGEIYLMDSLIHRVGKGANRKIRIHGHVKEQICDLMRSPAKSIVVRVERVQQQTNGVDCGLFAIAFAQYVLVNQR